VRPHQGIKAGGASVKHRCKRFSMHCR
jgi:hypothetical protein